MTVQINCRSGAAQQSAAYEPEAQAASSYQLPPLEILDTPKASDPSTYQKDIMDQCAVLEQTLADFKVRARVVAVTRGPSVTRFELDCGRCEGKLGGEPCG